MKWSKRPVVIEAILAAALLAGCSGTSPEYEVQQYRSTGVVHCVYAHNGAVIGDITGNESAITEGSPCPK